MNMEVEKGEEEKTNILIGIHGLRTFFLVALTIFDLL